MPDDDARSHGDIQRVLRTKLRNLEAAVGEVDDLLMYALHLVSENHGIFLAGNRAELLKWGRAVSLFNRIELITSLFERITCLFSGTKILPSNAIFRTECRLVDFRTWRR